MKYSHNINNKSGETYKIKSHDVVLYELDLIS